MKEISEKIYYEMSDKISLSYKIWYKISNKIYDQIRKELTP